MQVRAFSIKNKNQDLKIQTLKMTNQQCCRISVLCQTSKKKKIGCQVLREATRVSFCSQVI